MRNSIFMVSLVLSAFWAGCGDDDDGPTGTGARCIDVSGSWTLALTSPDPDAFVPMFSLPVEIARSGGCSVDVSSGLFGGMTGSGWVTTDSLYLDLQSPDSDPSGSESLVCALARESRYRFSGTWESGPDAGPAALYGPAPDCSGTVELSVGSGTTPVLSWDPECAVAFLLIEDSSGSDVWFVGGENVNTLEPPIVYGQIPGGLPGDEAVPLTAGEGYAAYLYEYIGDDRHLMVGYQSFTP